MNGEQEYATAEELRQWAATRGLPSVKSGRQWELLAKGWNRKHPERPYDPNRHGTTNFYTNRGCRCVECKAAMSTYMAGRYKAGAFERDNA